MSSKVVFVVRKVNKNRPDGITTFVHELRRLGVEFDLLEMSENGIFKMLYFLVGKRKVYFNSFFCIRFVFLAFVLRFFRTRVYFINHGNVSINNISDKKNLFRFFVNNVFCYFFDGVIVTSKGEYDAFKDKRKLLMLPLTVLDVGKEYVVHSRPRVKRIVYAGRMSNEKNVDVIVDAFEKVKDFVAFDLELYGDVVDGSDKRMRRYYRGCLSREQLGKVLAESNFSILLSSSESFSYFIAESLANATPVIVSRNIEWDVEKGFGYRVDIDSDQLAELFVKINSLSDCEIDIMGCKGFDYLATSFSPSKVLRLWRQSLND